MEPFEIPSPDSLSPSHDWSSVANLLCTLFVFLPCDQGERGVAAGTALNPRGKTATDIRSKYKAHTAKGSTKEGGGAPTNSDGPDKSASSVRRRAADLEDGWLAYDAETEFVRQGLIRSKSLDS